MAEANRKTHAKVFSHTLERYWNEGAWLMPTGGDDGKRPLLSFSKQKGHPLNLVMRKLQLSNSQTYGIRLNRMVVLDVDQENTDLISEICGRFGQTDCIVRTGRGFHLYYSTIGKVTLNLRGAGLPVDVKQGSNSFVLGPHSLRPDGVLYQFYKQPFSLCDVPRIKLENTSTVTTVASEFNKADSGTRHTFLIRKGLEYIECVDNRDELIANLLYDRDTFCADPSTVPDAEVEGIAKWWWEKRLQNQIYNESYSVFKFRRQAFHQLRAIPSGHVALDLYLYLRDKHGHISGKTFQISVDALQRTAGFAFGQKALRKAINQLLELGYLTVCKNYKVGHHGRIFKLTMPNNAH